MILGIDLKSIGSFGVKTFREEATVSHQVMGALWALLLLRRATISSSSCVHPCWSEIFGSSSKILPYLHQLAHGGLGSAGDQRRVVYTATQLVPQPKHLENFSIPASN